MSKSEQILKISPGRTQKFPKDWKLETLDEVSDVIDPYPSHRAPKLDPKGVPYLGIGDFDDNGNILKISRYVVPTALEEQKETFSLKKGDLALGRVASIGKVIKLNPKQDYTISPTLAIIQPKIKPDFLRQVMLGNYFQEQLNANVHGSTRNSVGIQTVRKIIVGVPKGIEIEKISSILANIESQNEVYKKIIKQTKFVKAGLMKKLFIKGIGHNKFKKVKWYFGKEIEIPEEWEIKQLSELCDNKNDIVAGPFGSNLLVDDYVEKGTPILRLQNIQRNNFINKNIKFVSKHKAEELKYHSYLPGDIILAKLGDPIGKTCVVPDNFPSGIVVADVVRIRVSNKNADKIFVEYVLNSNACKKQHIMEKIGTTRPRVNLEQIRKLIFPCPPIKEQKDISSIFLSMDSKIIDLNHKKYCLENLKKGLMQKLLTGQIRVTI